MVLHEKDALAVADQGRRRADRVSRTRFDFDDGIDKR
jgi:hypothetical protein